MQPVLPGGSMDGQVTFDRGGCMFNRSSLILGGSMDGQVTLVYVDTLTEGGVHVQPVILGGCMDGR